MEKRGVCWHCIYVTAKKPGYKVQFKVMAARFKLKTISNCLVIFFVSSKKNRSVVSRDIWAATKKQYLAKAKISFRFKQVFYY